MGFLNFVFKFLQANSVPIAKSVFKAYQETIKASKNANSANGPSHKVDDFLKTILSQTKLTAPPLDLPTAFNILNLEPKDQQENPKAALYRYYTLFKKNDPNNGGTVYMQSKVFAAKELIMNQYSNATELEQEFYKDVVEPEEREEERKKNKQESLNEDEDKENNSKK